MILSGQSCIPPSMVTPSAVAKRGKLESVCASVERKSGNQRETRRLDDRKADVADPGYALDPRGELGVDDEVPAENDLRDAAVDQRPQANLTVAPAPAG